MDRSVTGLSSIGSPGGGKSPSSGNSSVVGVDQTARSAKKLRKIAEDSFSFASEQKRHVIKGKNHHQQLISKYRQNVEQDLKNTKQQIIRHVLYSRALERAQTQIDIVQDALHSHLIEKSDPALWKTIQLRKLALKQDFSVPLDDTLVNRLNHRIGWIYPGLIVVLVEASLKYKDEEFSKALEAIPIAPMQINRELYLTIANRTTRGLISDFEASLLFDAVEKKIPLEKIHDAQNLENTSEISDEIYNDRWFMLKNILRKKIFRLYLARKAHEYIGDMEDKLKQKTAFFFPTAESTSIGTTSVASLASGLSEPATVADSTLSPNNKSLFTKSLTSLPSLQPSGSLTSPNHTISSKSKAKSNSKGGSIATYGVAPKKEKLSLREKLQQELNVSMAKQAELQGKITADLAKLFQEGMTSAPSSTASVTANTTAPSTAPSSSATMSLGSTSTSATKLQSPAVALYFKQNAIQKLVVAMEKYVRNIILLRLQHWKRISFAIDLEWKCCLFTQNIACARIFRALTWNYLRRLSEAWEQMKRFVRIFEEREKFAAAVDIQRHYRGFIARRLAKRVIDGNAANVIQGIMRIFIAKRLVKKIRHRVLLKKSVRKIENLWKKNTWKRALKKAFDQQRKQRAIQLIQRIYRGHRGRQRFMKYLIRRKKKIAATKFQCLWRRYRAVIRVDKLSRQRKRRRAAIVIQAMVRGKLKRLKFAVKWDRQCKAKILQYAWLCYKARKETMRRRRKRAAINIQRVARGMIARRRVKALRAKRQAAIRKIEPLGKGYITRRRIKGPMAKHLEKRSKAACKIQILLKAFHLGRQARSRVALIHRNRKESKERLHAIITIQRVMRGKLARKRVAKIREDLLLREQEALSNKLNRPLPYYYRLQKSYWQHQNMYHRKHAIKIQCFVRRFLARRRVHRIRVEQSVKKIQYFYKSAKLIEEAKELRRILSQQASRKQSMQMASISNIQRLVRGFITRRRVGKLRAAETIKWAIMEFRVAAKTRRAIATFRIRKIEAERRKAAAVKIQGLMRGVLQRRRYKKSHRSLLRQRALRIRAKKEKAALVIQCVYRCYRAKKRVAQQRILVGEKVKEREEMAALEKSIAGMHEDWMQQLLVIRAQTGIRGLLARNEFAKKVQEYKDQQIQIQKQKRHDAAAKIQALARGVSSRKRFKKNLPALKKALKMKSYCIECEAKVATRRCRQCKDRYCADCYDLLHQKGNRKTHSWENIKLDARIMALVYEESRGGGGGSGNDGNKKKGNPKDWEEHYDNAAKAKYWFNKKTGEASWISPFS